MVDTASKFCSLFRRKKKALEIGLWVIGPLLLGGIKEPLGRAIGIPSDLAREELFKLLTSPAGQDVWMEVMLYRATFLFLSCITVGMAFESLRTYRGWRYALFVLVPISGTLLLIWSFEESAIILICAVLLSLVSFLRSYMSKEKEKNSTKNGSTKAIG
jgi:hypothetical protein